MTKIKICGLMKEADIEAVNEAHPDFAGMILTSGFRRSITKDQASAMKAKLDPSIQLCGVFVNEPVDSMISFVKEGIIDVIQLHGSEDNGVIDTLHEALPDTKIFKAFKVTGEETLKEAEESHADFVLLDSGTGTGKTFDWSLIQSFPRPYILAGGLNPENVREAIRMLHPYAVDTSSGVETLGSKDRTRILAFADEVRKEEN